MKTIKEINNRRDAVLEEMRKIRSMERAGSEDTFKVGREDLRVCAGIRVSPKDVKKSPSKRKRNCPKPPS